MAELGSRASFFLALASVASISLVSAPARADELAYGPPPPADVGLASPDVRLHFYTPADAPRADLYVRDGIHDTLVCTSPCHPTVPRDAQLIARFGDGTSSKPIAIARGSELDVVVRPGGDYEAAGVLAMVGAVAATAGSVALFVHMNNPPQGEMNVRISHTFGYGTLGVLSFGAAAGLALVGIRLIRDPGPRTPDVSVKAAR